jgi:hypothetical protein
MPLLQERIASVESGPEYDDEGEEEVEEDDDKDDDEEEEVVVSTERTDSGEIRTRLAKIFLSPARNSTKSASSSSFSSNEKEFGYANCLQTARVSLEANSLHRGGNALDDIIDEGGDEEGGEEEEDDDEEEEEEEEVDADISFPI